MAATKEEEWQEIHEIIPVDRIMEIHKLEKLLPTETVKTLQKKETPPITKAPELLAIGMIFCEFLNLAIEDGEKTSNFYKDLFLTLEGDESMLPGFDTEVNVVMTYDLTSHMVLLTIELAIIFSLVIQIN